MVANNKDRIIVSLDKDTIRKLNLISRWYVCSSHPLPASKSEIVNDAINILSDKIGIK